MKKDYIDFFPEEKLAPRHTKDWVESAFDVDLNHETNPIGISHTRLYVGTIMRGRRVWYIFAVMLCGVIMLWSRTFYLQILRGHEFSLKAEGNRLRTIPITAERGIVYDRFNKELVHNIPNFSLSIIPQGLPKQKIDDEKRNYILDKLAHITGLSPEEITRQLDRASASTYQSLTIKENLDYPTAISLYLQNNDLPGIVVHTGSKRWYGPLTSSTYSNRLNATSSSDIFPSSMSHLLGYTSKLNDTEWEKLRTKNYLQTDTAGKTGVERVYENYLRGTYGKKIIEVDALEREQTTISVEAPTPGKNITLTIDIEAQVALEKALQQQLNLRKKSRGSAIALNPINGEIYALVSLPAFDSNDFAGGISSTTYNAYLNNPAHPLFNRAIGGNFPPGSTLKPVVAAAALEEKIVAQSTAFLSNGGIKVDRWFFPDWKAGGHGMTNVTKALAWSVNTFFYYVGGGYQDFKGLGASKILNYFTTFGLGQKTGIDLPGESAGFIPSPAWKEKVKQEPWYVGDTYNISIGQGDILVSPLQVGVWTAAIANGGRKITPHVIEKIVDPLTKETITPFNQATSSPLASPSTVNIVRQGMRECVTYGSCKMLGSLPFTSAGKTGTAQWSHVKDTHAWFSAFAPFNNPQVVVVVLVEEGGEGSVVAEPVARDFLAWWGKKYLTP